MELQWERPGDHLYIRAVSDQGIQVGETWHRGPIVLSANRLLSDWPVASMAELREPALECIFGLRPEVVLIGTGARQQFPGAEIRRVFLRRSIGMEAMTTRAACYTFNLLVAEGRQVVAALIPALEAERDQSNSGVSE